MNLIITKWLLVYVLDHKHNFHVVIFFHFSVRKVELTFDNYVCGIFFAIIACEVKETIAFKFETIDPVLKIVDWQISKVSTLKLKKTRQDSCKVLPKGCVTVAEVPQRRQKIQSKTKQGNWRKVAWRDVRPKFRKARAKSFPKKRRKEKKKRRRVTVVVC